MNGLDLFSGIGGISIALSDWVTTVAYCERDPYAQAVLLSNMQDGSLHKAPIWDDITTIHASMLPAIDIIFGGFPCQDISVAGNGKGLEGERSGLFYEVVRLTKEIRPSFVFLENVPAIRTRGLEQVIKAFTEIRYDCRWTCVSAESVGAPHKRERWFLLAHTNSSNLWEQSGRSSGADRESQIGTRVNGQKESLANTMRPCLEGQRKESFGVTTKQYDLSDSSWWTVEPNMGRVADGIAFRVDRIKCLGNGVVPQQVQKAFKILIGMNEEHDLL